MGPQSKMIKTALRVLVLGYGNPGRLDDGLGPAFAEALEKMPLDNVTIDCDYQLTVEDAALVAEHDIVIFADAAVDGREPFYFETVQPGSSMSFSSHSISPSGLLALTKELFGKSVNGYVLGIRGYDFNEFGEWLSKPAQNNLSAALQFFMAVLPRGDFQAAARQYSKNQQPKPDSVNTES